MLDEMDTSQEEIKTTDEGHRKKGKTKSGGERSFLDKYKSYLEEASFWRWRSMFCC